MNLVEVKVGDVVFISDAAEYEQEVGGNFRAGKLKNKEPVVEGIGQAVGAFLGLFEKKY